LLTPLTALLTAAALLAAALLAALPSRCLVLLAGFLLTALLAALLATLLLSALGSHLFVRHRVSLLPRKDSAQRQLLAGRLCSSIGQCARLECRNRHAIRRLAQIIGNAGVATRSTPRN
jgi:hypothetical protein